ncbi:sulfur carrier protein ThiS [Phyllobacterium sp. 21LDTY02-6]|uniref:sulfur carrier protein ThiS n=1 Tax=Phyllobacterium sp. 21LDTY02-6 TaxID=2944903 RepID=UPI002022493F|nr:sulfur carrier protein ThiS [Phyllobacterium sp. 21LDTY02-6]MCO4316045.1 sulfur carrier protein ThiS [Phyllobacterium sp. 21LDTY02-6]
MRLIINGEPREVTAQGLGEVLAELEFTGDWLATAVNSQLVPAAERAGFVLSDGDRVEILTPKQGG